MPRGWVEPQLQQMVTALRHESFYATGMWADESAGVYVGWAARKNSFSDGMPLRNELGDVVLVFSGEEYPEAGSARRLTQRAAACWRIATSSRESTSCHLLRLGHFAMVPSSGKISISSRGNGRSKVH